MKTIFFFESHHKSYFSLKKIKIKGKLKLKSPHFLGGGGDNCLGTIGITFSFVPIPASKSLFKVGIHILMHSSTLLVITLINVLPVGRSIADFLKNIYLIILFCGSSLMIDLDFMFRMWKPPIRYYRLSYKFRRTINTYRSP